MNNAETLDFQQIQSQKLIQILKEIKCASNLEKLKSCATSYLYELGFDKFMFFNVNRNWEAPKNRNGILTNIHVDILENYLALKPGKYDPVIKVARENETSFFSHKLYIHSINSPIDYIDTSTAHKIYKYLISHDIHNQYVICSKSSNVDSRACFWVSSCHELAEKNFLPIGTNEHLTRLMRAIDLKLSTRIFLDFYSGSFDEIKISISEKPRQILQALANRDSSIGDIAKEFCISPITAHQHVASARQALGVNSNIAAVLKAINLGLITGKK